MLFVSVSFIFAFAVVPSLHASDLPTLKQPLPSVTVPQGAAAFSTDLRSYFEVTGIQGPVVQFRCDLGTFNLEMLPSAAPLSVSNFLRYVNAGRYVNNVVHRSDKDLGIIQGGLYTVTSTSLPLLATYPAIPLEYNLPNARGTVAMARSGDPNSATSGWFINTKDNTSSLAPSPDGAGYAVFGRVTGTGMAAVDAIAALPIYWWDSHKQWPLNGYTGETNTMYDVYYTNIVAMSVAQVVPLFPVTNGQVAVVSFAVTNSNPALATATVSGSSLIVAPAAGQTGYADLTVTATDSNGNAVQDTFRLSVCAYGLSVSSASFGSAGGEGSFGVTAGSACAWSTVADAAWLRTASSGSGNGTVSFTVDANTSTNPRSGTITAGGQTFTVNQMALVCTFALNSAGTNVPAGSAAGRFTVSANDGCSWSAVPSATWLHTTSSGTGSGTIFYTVETNATAAARSGTIAVGGQTFTVNQAGVPPVITQQPASQTVAGGATAYLTTGATGPSLAWQWQKDGVNLSEGGHYTGVNASTLVIHDVQLGDAGQYSAWVGNAAGWVKSSNATLTVCAYTVSPANACFGSSGGTNSLGVSHSCGYSYSATNPVPWMHVLSGAAGATPGTLIYRVDANPAGTARSGALSIGGQTHTVFQAGTNTWTIYWQHTDGTPAAWYMDGTNLALNGAMLLTPSQIDPTWQLMAAADLNRDSRPELLWQHQAGALGLWYLNGTALASAGTLTPGKMGPEWKIVATPDLSGDGKAEVLWQSDVGWLGLWFMDGATMTNASYLTPNKVDPNWRMAGALDLNGDRRPEILWRHKDGGLGAWFLNGLVATNFAMLTPAQVAASWKIVGAGNRKPDGKPMILWQSDRGEIGVWYLNGTAMESFSWLNPSQVAPAWRIKGMVQP